MQTPLLLLLLLLPLEWAVMGESHFLAQTVARCTTAPAAHTEAVCQAAADRLGSSGTGPVALMLAVLSGFLGRGLLDARRPGP